MNSMLATLGVAMDRITLSLPPEPDFHPTLRLVVGGIGARSELSYEQVSELQLAVENLVANHAVVGEALRIEAAVDDGGISLVLGPFATQAEPSRFLVLERLVTRAAVVERDGGGHWLELATEVAGT